MILPPIAIISINSIKQSYIDDNILIELKSNSIDECNIIIEHNWLNVNENKNYNTKNLMLVLKPGIYEFILTVKNNKNLISTDNIIVEVKNSIIKKSRPFWKKLFNYG